jgi:hypothetical protein
VTRAKAQKKAKARTAAGTPTKVVKDACRPGGYKTASVASRRAAVTRYDRSAKGRAARARYNRSEKGRASKARKNLGVNNGEVRLGRDGTRFREADLIELHQEQRGKCFVLDVSLDGTLSDGRTARTIDHSWSTGFVRRLLHRDANIIAGLLEKHGITSWSALNIFAHKMAALFLMPFLTMTEEEARKAKRRAKANAKRAA